MENYYPERDAHWPGQDEILLSLDPLVKQIGHISRSLPLLDRTRSPAKRREPKRPPVQEPRLVMARYETTSPASRKERLERSPLFAAAKDRIAPNGSYAGRPIIGDLSRLDGGVYVSPNPCEAVVMNEHSRYLKRSFHALMEQILLAKRLGKDLEHTVIREAVLLTRKALHYNTQNTNRLLARESIEPDEPVKIDLFLKEGCGAARHQVLHAGWLLEQLKMKDILRGYVFVDVDEKLGETDRERLVYVSRWGQLIVFDPAISAEIQN